MKLILFFVLLNNKIPNKKVLEDNFKQDIINIENITIVPNLLNVICQTTGMGFAAVARVTEDRWITCSVQDNVNFGLNQETN
ncbi:hypothetical protein ACQKCJ_19320 [Flavobacterium sp. NPDC079362]|uniref:hypothetical protein n=1 Tax=Flavobacterium sp. NPDC079362 TaxID=3390566 RepID=UPI003D06FB85